MKVGSLVYATDQGLGILAKSFFDHGIIGNPLVVQHAHHVTHRDWYPYSAIVPIRGLSREPFRQLIRDYCKAQDVMLFFETPFDWGLIDYCQEKGVKTVLMPMHECTPAKLPYLPDLFLCPSMLDFRCFQVTGADGANDGPLVKYLPVPVKVEWKQRERARVFVHNAGHGGLIGRNGTREVLEAWNRAEAPAKLILRSQEPLGFGLDDQTVRDANTGRWKGLRTRTIKTGTIPHGQLYAEGDVFLFPEKFNGLSLPLQEARAAGMLVMATDRFPMNQWLPREVTCPACDGDGSLMYEWGKTACLKIGGRKVPLPEGSWYYETPDGKDMGFKTIGGFCSLCRGQKTASPLIATAGHRKNKIGSAYREFDETIVDPKDIAAEIDDWYDRDISEYSLAGREWAETMSWAALGPKYLQVLEELCG